MPTQQFALKQEMTVAQVTRMDLWFTTARSAYSDRLIDLDNEVNGLPPGNMRQILMTGEKLKVEGDFALLRQRQNAFNAVNGGQAMRPPSKTDIEETKRLAGLLGKAIADQVKTEAITKFISTLVGQINRVSTLTTKS